MPLNKENQTYVWLRKGRDEFMPFAKVKTALSRFWTWLTDSIFYEDFYTTIQRAY